MNGYKNLYSHSIFNPTVGFGVSPKFVHRDQLPQQGFGGTYFVTEETAEAVKQEGTVKHFKGIVWSEYLWMDFDSYEAAERAENKLREMGYGFIAYDTGGRGAHFGVLRAHPPSHLLPHKDKQWVGEHFPEADTSIYTHLHLLRLPGSVHEKTGRKKERVVEVEGKALVLPRYEEKVLPSALKSSQQRTSVLKCFRVMSYSRPVARGDRQHSLVTLTYALKDDAQVDAAFALEWVRQVNLLYEEPKEDHELEKIVSGIYNRGV